MTPSSRVAVVEWIKGCFGRNNAFRSFVKLLNQSALFCDLSAEEKKAVEGCLKPRAFAKGEMIFQEGAVCRKIFVVESGRVRLYRVSDSGREQTLEILGPGESCACHPGDCRSACGSNAQALIATRVWFLPLERFTKLLTEQPSVSMALNRIFAGRLKVLGSLLEDVSLADTRKRLVRFLIDMLENHPEAKRDGGVLEIPFTREEIAHRLGAARETIARNLSSLKKEGLIDMPPRQIRILDLARLRKFAK